MNDFLTFRKFMTPVAIQVLFWLGVIGVVITGLYMIAKGGSAGALLGILYIIIGPIVVRIYMEVLIIVFRLYDSVRHVEQALTGGARPATPGPQMGGAYGGQFGPGAPVGPPPMAPAGPPPMAPAGPPTSMPPSP